MRSGDQEVNPDARRAVSLSQGKRRFFVGEGEGEIPASPIRVLGWSGGTFSAALTRVTV